MSYESFKKYCDFIHPNGDNYFAIYGQGQPIQIFKVDPTEKVYNELKAHNHNGYDIYTVVQPSIGFKDIEVKGCRFVFADWDAGRDDEGNYYATDKVKELKTAKIAEWKQMIDDDELLSPSLVVSTRNGFQPYWKIQDNGDSSTLKSSDAYIDIQQRIAAKLGSDTSVCNPARVLRVPGFNWMKINEGLAPYLTTIIKISGKTTYTSEELSICFPTTDETEAYKKCGRGRSHSSCTTSNRLATDGSYWVCFQGHEPFEVDFFWQNGQLHGACQICDDNKGHDLVIRGGDMGYCNRCKSGFYAATHRSSVFSLSRSDAWEKIKEAKAKHDFSSLEQQEISFITEYLDYKHLDITPQEYIEVDNNDDLPWCGAADEPIDNLSIEEDILAKVEHDFDHTERRLELLLKSKKDDIEKNIKDMIGDKYYNYIHDMTEQIGIIQNDVIPFFIYNCIGSLSGNSVTTEWITNYHRWLNTFSCCSAEPGSGKSPLQDVFLKYVRDIYISSEANVIAKNSIDQINSEVSNKTNSSKNLTYQDPIEDEKDFDNEVVDEVVTDDEDENIFDLDSTEPVLEPEPEPDEDIKRYSIFLDNTTSEARVSTMANCGYAFQSGSEITEYVESKYSNSNKGEIAETNKFYSGAAVNVNRKSRKNEKVPNCCMSIMTEGQEIVIQSLFDIRVSGTGSTARFDFLRLGRRRSRLSSGKVDEVVKSEFDELMLSIADSRLMVSNHNPNLVFDQPTPDSRLVNAKCHYKGNPYVILSSKFKGTYHQVLLSRLMKPLNKESVELIKSRHRIEIEPIISYSDVVTVNMKALLQKITERLTKYIGITSLVRYTFGKKDYFDYDTTDVNYAFNYLYYSLYHNMTNEYRQPKQDKDMAKLVSKIYNYFKNAEATRIDWSSINTARFVKTQGRAKFRDLIKSDMEPNGFFREIKDGNKIVIEMIDESKIQNYIKKGDLK